MSFKVLLPIATSAAITALPLQVHAQGGQAAIPGAGYYQAAPDYTQNLYPQYSYGQGATGYDPSQYGYSGQSGYVYTQPGYDTGYPQQPYGSYSYGAATPNYGYAQQPGYGYAQQPGYGYAQQPGYGYTQQPGYGYMAQDYYPGYGSSSGFGPLSGNNVPWNNWSAPDVFGEKSPFQDPLQHEGYWTKKGFRPWRSGPFAYDKWEDHPGTQMPWGNFPGWGKGFFGGFGPDTWEGTTPWGNDVPFKWVDPTDPEESFAEIWEDALNTPSKMGRLPPGWTAPYISVPNPIDVENEFERNMRNAPDEIHKMWGDGGGFSGTPSDSDKESDKEEKPKDKEKQSASDKDKAPAS